MSNNVVNLVSESEPASGRQHNDQPDRLGGQKQPRPFLLNADNVLDTPQSYYLKTEALAQLQRHILQVIAGRGAMQVIIAEHGRGKSAFLRHLIAEAGSGWQLCYIQADYHLGADHIISGLGETFFPQEEVDFEALIHGLASYGRNEPSPVVMVDDAQNLSSYAIEILANIKRIVTEHGGDLDMILCASPALRSTLVSHSMSSFRDEWIELHALPRFSEEETAEYLNHYFENSDTAQFTPAQITNIHRRACGVPAYINYHAELALGREISDERIRLEHQQMVARKQKQPYFIGGAVTVVLLLVVVIVAFSSSEPERPVMTPISIPPVASLTEAEQTAHEDNDNDVVSAEIPDQSKKTVATPAVAANVKPAPTPKLPVRPVKEPKSAPVQRVPKTTTRTEATSSVAQVEPKSIPQAEKVAEKVAAVTESSPVINRAVTSDLSQQNPVAAKVSTPQRVATDTPIPGSAWLKAQPPENYTIQLAGSPDEKNIIRYIRRSALDGELAYVLLKRKNRSSWYVVLHGSFESRGEALDVVDFFPPELKKHQPWIRQFSRLQKGLDED